MNKAIINFFNVIIMTGALVACNGTNEPTLGDKLKSQGVAYETLAKDWDKGNKMINAGEKLIREGNKEIKSGRKKVDRGEDMVRDGQRLVKKVEKQSQTAP